MSHGCEEDGCCKHTSNMCSQTLKELEFERGIWQAAIDGDNVKIEKLLKKNVTVNMKDSSGYTALHYASRNGHFETVCFLIHHGACVNCHTKSGMDRPLHRAAYIGNEKIVKVLIDNGADANLQNADGHTCLHKSVKQGNTTVTEILQQRYPHLSEVEDNNGLKPRDYQISKMS